ncbi:unnamed protein product [Ceratitis capitata]|uniref:(Mediterranean fruit fly) hypothetical protein n=1 Tax=Ceratitis capitata TaxID=7213 RepID=A0A811UXC4_CERCA|nr:unnamed protein product [Ceratitis capitata]
MIEQIPELKPSDIASDAERQLIYSKHFTEVEKTFRLKSLFSGEAGRLIQHRPVTEANYEAASTLQERYEIRRLQFTTQTDSKHEADTTSRPILTVTGNAIFVTFLRVYYCIVSK